MPKNTLIISDMHHRISGVSTSIRSLLPILNEQCSVTFAARKDHGNIKAIGLIQLMSKLLKLPQDDLPIWHVRRNNEMFWGILARNFLNRNLKLVFTSAAIRKHSLWPRYLISKMDAVIATSIKAAELVPHVKAIVPHGIDVKVFSTPEKAEMPWNKFHVAIGIVGRVRPEKGTDIFSDAICEILPENPHACAVIVGKTTKKFLPMLKRMKLDWLKAGIADRVFVLDEVEMKTMPAVYQTLDVVCCPALYEGFGLVPIEAMVSGTAIVASKTGAYPDMIQEDKNGYLVDCGDRLQFKRALTRILEDVNKLERFKSNGQEIVNEHYTLKREVDGIMSVYQQFWSNQ